MTRFGVLKRESPLALRGKVGRTIQSLTRTFSVSAERGAEQPTEFPFVSDEAVTEAIKAWSQRTSYVPGALISEPSWGMLLELLQAEIQGRRAYLSRLCKVSNIPASSAVRWLKAFEHHALVIRRIDPHHPNDEIFELSRKGSSALRRYFHEVVQSPGE